MRKEAIKQPKKNLKQNEKFKLNLIFCSSNHFSYWNPFFNFIMLQIMKNYLTKQKPQILTAQIFAIDILTNFIFNLIN